MPWPRPARPASPSSCSSTGAARSNTCRSSSTSSVGRGRKRLETGGGRPIASRHAMEGVRTTMHRRRTHPGFWTLLALAGLLLAAAVVRADAPTGPALLAVRSWSAPSNTRVVFDFNLPVAPVAPDSGATRELVVSVPHPGLVPADGIAPVMVVRDSAVDSVFTTVDAAGAHFRIVFAPGVTFKVFALPAAEGRPFRVVVDAIRATAQAEEDRRLANLGAAKRQTRDRLIMIDAGHGGDDTGARGPGGVLEKNVTLAV